MEQLSPVDVFSVAFHLEDNCKTIRGVELSKLLKELKESTSKYELSSLNAMSLIKIIIDTKELAAGSKNSSLRIKIFVMENEV